MKKLLLIIGLACGLTTYAQIEVSSAAVGDTIFIDSDDTTSTQNLLTTTFVGFAGGETDASRFDQKSIEIQSDANGDAKVTWQAINTSSDTLWFSISIYSSSTSPFASMSVTSPAQKIFSGSPGTAFKTYTDYGFFYLAPNETRELVWEMIGTGLYRLGHIGLIRIDKPSSPVKVLADSDIGTTVELNVATAVDQVTSLWSVGGDLSGTAITSKSLSGNSTATLDFNLSLPTITSNDAHAASASGQVPDTLEYTVTVEAQNNSASAFPYNVFVLVDGELVETIEIPGAGTTGLVDHVGTATIKFVEGTTQLLQLRSSSNIAKVESVKLVIGSEVITNLDEFGLTASEFKMFPNPVAKGEDINIQLSQDLTSSVESIEITDVMGNTVASFSSVESVSTAGLAQGLYVVNIKTTSGALTSNRFFIK